MGSSELAVRACAVSLLGLWVSDKPLSASVSLRYTEGNVRSDMVLPNPEALE